MDAFLLNRNTVIETDWDSEPVRRAVARLRRDLEMTLTGEACARITITRMASGQTQWKPEQYRIRAVSVQELTVEASDELGVVYALIAISRQYLGVLPFWFWNDQAFVKRDVVSIPVGTVMESEPYAVEFRGWFVNDEVLISHWDAGVSAEYPWEMAFEALLRCGGNLVIPGTDSNSKKYTALAEAMGLWITQHHAEPLGAEMFSRAYPELTPSFAEHGDLFRKLWREGIELQKDQKVIWNLGFRGQGDVPFWENDPRYDTPQKRGQLISSIMGEQYEMVCQAVENPVCCVNLYGETMELYKQGFLELPEHVILIWADNGYGEMVSRRQWNHNPRIPALPDPSMGQDDHGMYYHASFYDLQAAFVLTMLPNSMEFVHREVETAYQRGIRRLWLINCSNVKPHVYVLDYLAAMWKQTDADPKEHLSRYLDEYYGCGGKADGKKLLEECFAGYYQAVIPYGSREDEHAGEQFYNDVARVFLCHWMKDGGREACEEHAWCMPMDSFSAQMAWYEKLCGEGADRFERLLEACRSAELALEEAEAAGDGQKQTQSGSVLWKDSMVLQCRLHAFCARGASYIGRAFRAFDDKDYKTAFYLLGKAADSYSAAVQAMRDCGHDKWKGFYDNDAQADIGFTVSLIKTVMGYVRSIGDGPYFYEWQRLALYPPRDRKIMLILSDQKRLTDEELYEKM
ncbi:MAG: glycosyl hydrolase 115 family protein [Eubacteriales bacterium]|nr:glycosyl hydrolase 115 family protein [Eubacteriales bacterium]